MRTEIGYVITATRDNGERLYYAIDQSSGYPTWLGFYAAKTFPNAASARDTLKSDLARMPYLLHSASGADNEKPQRTVTLAVELLSAEPDWQEACTFTLKD